MNAASKSRWSKIVRSSCAPSFVLAENEIHVWLVSLDDAGISLESVADYLSLAERERAARFKFDRDRRRYIVAHRALRSIVRSYVNGNPLELQFDSGPQGKPRLAGETAGRVEFNLSHSHELALLALTRGREIGIDVEYMRSDFAFAEVAERFFTAREVTALRALPLDLQREGFYKCWTSKEAFLKGKGTGLSGELDEVELLLLDNQRVQINSSVPGWNLTEVDVDADYAGALAVEGGAGYQLNYYCWDPSLPLCAIE